MTIFRALKKKLFYHFVNKAEFRLIPAGSIKSFTPFRVLEAVLSDDKKLVFSVMHDRRKRSLFSSRRRRSIFNLHTTFLVKVEVHKDLPEQLKEFNDIHLLTIDVFGAFLFSDEIVSEVLLDCYLNNMIKVLSKRNGYDTTA